MKVSKARSKQLSLRQLGAIQRIGNNMCLHKKMVHSCLLEMLVERTARYEGLLLAPAEQKLKYHIGKKLELTRQKNCIIENSRLVDFQSFPLD